MRIFWLLSALCLLASCNKPLTNPEDIDPIYRDLISESGVAQKDVEEKEKKLLEVTEDLKKIVPQTGQTRKAYSALYLAENNLRAAKQKYEYYKIRSQSRKFEARASYIEAFKAEKPWPEPSEYSKYQTEKSLKTANRDWRKREVAKKEEPKPQHNSGH